MLLKPPVVVVPPPTPVLGVILMLKLVKAVIGPENPPRVAQELVKLSVPKSASGLVAPLGDSTIHSAVVRAATI